MRNLNIIKGYINKSPEAIKIGTCVHMELLGEIPSKKDCSAETLKKVSEIISKIKKFKKGLR